MLQLDLIGSDGPLQRVLSTHEGTRDREQQHQIEDRGKVKEKGDEKSGCYQSIRDIRGLTGHFIMMASTF